MWCGEVSRGFVRVFGTMACELEIAVVWMAHAPRCVGIEDGRRLRGLPHCIIRGVGPTSL